MSKLFWSTEEWDVLRANAVQLLVETPYLRKEQVLERAQLALPEARRRKVTYSAVHRYKDFLDLCRAMAKDQPQEPTTAAPAPSAPVDPLLGALDALLDALADKLAERLAARLNAPAPAAAPPTTRHNPAPPPTTPATPPRTTVLIVGLLGAQCHQIKNSFAHRLEITCLTSEEANSRPTLHKDHTILMTKFLSHSTQTKYRKSSNLWMCNGGTSELGAILKSLN
jgi:hypothetical protein